MRFPARRLPLILSCALAIAALAAFLPSVQNGFVALDDDGLVYENRDVLQPSLPALARLWTSYDAQKLYKPLTMMSYQLDVLLDGTGPVQFHLTNILLHALCVVLVFAFLRRLLGGVWMAFALALLFCLHPIQVETVAWISSRKDLLSTAFLLGSALIWLHGRDTARGRFVSLMLFLCALLSKGSVLYFPLMLMLLDARDSRRFVTSLRHVLPMLILGAGFAAIGSLPYLGERIGAGGIEAWFVTLRGITLTMRHLLYPSGLSALYPYPQLVLPAAFPYLSSALLLLAVSAVCLALRKHVPDAGFGWLFFLCGLLPVLWNGATLGLIVTADRYAYLTLIGFFLALLTPLRALWTRLSRGTPAWVPVLPALVTAAILFCLVYDRTAVWRDSVTLYTNILQNQSNAWVARANFGVLLYRSGKAEAGAQMQRSALAVNPRFDTAYFNLGVIRMAQGRIRDARGAFRMAVSLNPSGLNRAGLRQAGGTDELRF